jgi:ubiquinone/menaquinone biosynthesis C-methylase UbiE
MLYDLKKNIPGIKVNGIDISEYAIENSLKVIKEDLIVGNATNLPYEDNSFDVVISINTVHNLDIENCAKALKEIQRVSKKHSFITVDAYRNDKEKESMYAWNLTAKTIMSVEGWLNFFDKNDYKGDYFWFIP